MHSHGQEHVETLIVGGGQAGLATGAWLKRLGRPFLILDERDRVGDTWRHRWDSLRLFTTARYDRLPGMPFPAPATHYPTKDEVADYLQAYAERFQLSIRTGVTVQRLTSGSLGYEATTSAGMVTADNVVLATGMYRTPKVPEFAQSLDPGIRQLHSRDYRNPAQLAPGTVLVVGAGNSGAEIALDLAPTHRVILAGRDPGHEPTRSGTLPDLLIMPLVWFAASRILTSRNPIGRRAREHFLHPPRGIPLGRVRPKDIPAAGIERAPRVSGIHEGRPQLDDGRTLDVSAVVWCTGFDPDLSFVDPPLRGRDGYPDNDGGIITDRPGLYVMGLAFQTSLSSALLGGVGRDADAIAHHISASMMRRGSSEGVASVSMR
jgi:putative flavoprotein involved in K+ transport